MNLPDPFTGTWVFRGELSALSTPPPQSWIQQIYASADELRVREDIVRPAGPVTVIVEARFDGKEYPVAGSPVVDAIAYTRVDVHTIHGTGWKDKCVSLIETVIAASEGNAITLTYSILSCDREVASGIAVFERLNG